MIDVSGRWAVRAFRLAAHPTVGGLWNVVLPSGSDITAVTRTPLDAPIGFEVTALVRVDNRGAVIYTDPTEVVIAILRVGDDVPLRSAPSDAPRLIGCVGDDAQPYRWAYFMASGRLELDASFVPDVRPKDPT